MVTRKVSIIPVESDDENFSDDDEFNGRLIESIYLESEYVPSDEDDELEYNPEYLEDTDEET